MTDQLISRPTAELAKEKGFNWPVKSFYKADGQDEPASIKCIATDYNKMPHVSAPTQSLLQKWLREKHLIYIVVRKSTKDWWMWCIQDHVQESYRLNSYEEALEEGLKKALTLIPCDNSVPQERVYKILDCTGVEMPGPTWLQSLNERYTFDEADRMVKSLNESGEYRPYSMKKISDD